MWVSGWPFFFLSFFFLIEEKSRWERRVYLSVVSVSGGVCAMRLKLKGPHNVYRRGSSAAAVVRAELEPIM